MSLAVQVARRIRQRIVPLVVALGFSVHRMVRADYWGVGFGLFWVAYVFLFLRAAEDQSPRMRQARLTLGVTFAVFCLIAVWRTAVHGF